MHERQLRRYRRTAGAIVTGIGLLLVALAPASSATAEDTFDWVLVEISVPEGTAWLKVAVYAYGTTSADHVPFGLAIALPGTSWPSHSYGFDDVRQGQYAGMELGVAAGGVNERVEVGLNRATNTYSASLAALFQPEHTSVARTFYYLVMAPNLGATEPFGVVVDSSWGGPLPFSTTTGAGSTAVRVSDLSSGLGVSAGPASTGTGTATMTLPDGIVGSHTFECVGTCESAWHSPDGRSGTWTQSGNPLIRGGRRYALFAGPAGDWQWDFAGSQEGDSIALFAPVGDAWQHFQ